MADKTEKGVSGHFNKDPNSPVNDRSKASEEEKQLKEKLLDEKMKLIRQKNEERLRRQKEIEEDIKYASLHSSQVADEKPAVAVEHRMAGVQKDNSSGTRIRGRARGRILEKMSKEKLQAQRFENKKRQNYEDVENELKEEKKSNSSPIGGSLSFLSDERRVDMSKVSSRSSHSWGGSQFEDVVDKVNKEKHAQPRRDDQNIEVVMTGKERKQYLEWKEERNRIDRERKLRQKTGENWKREWDREKVHREVRSTDGRHDQHHTRRSGQRFGERTRRKPDWDLHDDRVPERDLQHPENNRKNENNQWEEQNDQKSSIASNKTEDWEDSSSTSVERHSESGLKAQTISTENLEDSAAANINETGDSNMNHDRNETLDSQVSHSEISKESHATDRLDSEGPEENDDKEGTNIDMMNLTVTIDSKGKRNISDEPTNNNTSSHPDKSKVTVSSSDKNEKNEDGVVQVKQDEVIEQPKPQRIHKKHRHREDKHTQNTTEQEKEDKEVVKNKETNASHLEPQGETSVTDEQVEPDSTTNSISDSSSHHDKSKDNLPKLEIKKVDENNEPLPDFLKTPQKKNWADCEFDEELDLPPLEWSSLMK